MRPVRHRIVALVLAALVASCASVEQAPGGDDAAELQEDENDPLEPFNRQMFALNLAVDTLLLRPISVGYGELVPGPVKTGIRNVLNNLREPFTLVNELAQGNFERAQQTYGRFLLNSLYGVGGIFDVASDYGVGPSREDFGQTLAVWGVPDGWYLVLPGLGPSNLRDTAGRGVQWYADPVGLVGDEIGAGTVLDVATGVNVVDRRWRTLGTVDALRRDSLDFYAAVRSAYRQRRAQAVLSTEPSRDVEPE